MITIGIHYLEDIASVDVRGKFIKGQGGFQLQMLISKVLLAGTTKIILNLSEVPMVDSMGIGEIVRAFTTVQEAGGILKLVGLTERVYGALQITPSSQKRVSVVHRSLNNAIPSLAVAGQDCVEPTISSLVIS